MTTPLFHYPARSLGERSIYSLPSQRVRPPFAGAELSTRDAFARAIAVRRAMRTGACIGAAFVGGIGLAVGCLAVAVSWLLAVEAHSNALLGAAEWAASVTTIGVVAGGIAGGVMGALVGTATRVMRRAQ